MGRSIVMRSWLVGAAAFAMAAPASASTPSATGILIHDERSAPESLTVSPGGDVIVGSASSPFIYIVRKGETTAKPFVDLSREGPSTFFGVLADAASGTLWACNLTPAPNGRRSSLRGFDLKTGRQKLRWDLPDEASTCNDLSVGPDKALYFTDTANGKIYRLAPGSQSADLFLAHRVLAGIDGITFLDGVLYVNNIAFSKLYRIPIDATGKPGAPVDIWMDAPVRGPDGMRAANNRLFVTEGGAGKVIALTISGDTAHVTLLRESLRTPTGVEPTGNMLWFTERTTGKIWSVPIPR